MLGSPAHEKGGLGIHVVANTCQPLLPIQSASPRSFVNSAPVLPSSHLPPPAACCNPSRLASWTCGLLNRIVLWRASCLIPLYRLHKRPAFASFAMLSSTKRAACQFDRGGVAQALSTLACAPSRVASAKTAEYATAEGMRRMQASRNSECPK